MVWRFFFVFCLYTSASYTAALYADGANGTKYADHAEIKVLAFAGSTRCDSINQKLVQEAARLAKEMEALKSLI